MRGLLVLLAPFLLGRPTAAAPTVVLDPGHPSEVGAGTRGRQLSEVGIAWRVALDLKRDLQAAGVRVILTKSAERAFVTNRRRAEIANRAKANLMLRLHGDAGSGSGFAVYYPTRQGRSGGRVGPSPALLRRIEPIARRFWRKLGERLAGSLPNGGLRGDERTAVGSRQGALTGSVFSEVPVLLVEMAVLTNPKDEAFLLSASGERRMVRALAAATLAALGR